MKSVHSKFLIVILAIVMVGLSGRPFWEAVQINRLSLQTLHAILVDPDRLPVVNLQLEQASIEYCRLNWLIGMVAARLGDLDRQEEIWSIYLSCRLPGDLNLVHAGARQNRVLAERATQLYPKVAESWFWLAEISAGENQPEQAIQQYQQVVRLEPVNGLAWCRLGQLLREQNLLQAREAYRQCCFNGDPGRNGCLNAGGIEEGLGNYQEAIRYYRRSHLVEYLHRADSLEARPTPTP